MVVGRRRIVLAGYLIRFPLGGYAWQVLHYLLGFRALGYDVWFYEDTGYYAPAFNPSTGEFGPVYDYGIATAAGFLERFGFRDHWVFVDTASGMAYGAGATQAETLIREADLVVNLGRMNRLPLEQRDGRLAIYIDLDPVYTQIQLANGDRAWCEGLGQQTYLFTYGENIGTPRSPVPSGGYTWRPTRPPVSLAQWHHTHPPGSAYTTVGKWDAVERNLVYQGKTLQWRKRTEWLRFLELPEKTRALFEVAMNVDSVSGDLALLTTHGWKVVDPIAISSDPWRYRDYICGSRGEFTVAKDMNIRLRSGWFSDRTACYLAAGRPVVEQNTGFDDILPLGPGLHAFRTLEEAAEAILTIEADYQRASRYALEVAQEYFAAEKVLRRLLQEIGL